MRFIQLLVSLSGILLSQAANVANVPSSGLEATILVLSASARAIKLSVTIANNGQDTYRILNTPISLFDPSGNTEKFNPRKKSDPDIRPVFNGRKGKYGPDSAAARRKVVTLRPREHTTVVHDLVGLYDFSQSGTGVYVLLPEQFVQILDSRDQDQLVTYSSQPRAEITISTLSLRSDDLNRFVVQTSNHSAQLANRYCTANQNALIDQAALAAKDLVRLAYQHVDTYYYNWSPRLTRWFGARGRTEAQAVKVKATITGLYNQNFRTYTYDCSCPDQDTYAWVLPTVPGVVNLCPLFWTAPLDGADSKGKSSHFTNVAGTEDHVYGRPVAEQFARDWPELAVRNADSYEFFVENAP